MNQYHNISLLYTGAPKQQYKKATEYKKWYCFKKKLKKIEPIPQYGTLINIGAPSNKETKEAARGRIRMD